MREIGVQGVAAVQHDAPDLGVVTTDDFTQADVRESPKMKAKERFGL